PSGAGPRPGAPRARSCRCRASPSSPTTRSSAWWQVCAARASACDTGRRGAQTAARREPDRGPDRARLPRAPPAPRVRAPRTRRSRSTPSSRPQTRTHDASWSISSAKGSFEEYAARVPAVAQRWGVAHVAIRTAVRPLLLCAGLAVVGYLIWDLGPGAIWDAFTRLSWRGVGVGVFPAFLFVGVGSLRRRFPFPPPPRSLFRVSRGPPAAAGRNTTH